MTNLDYLYNKNAAPDIFGKNYFVDKELGFRVIERGTILPNYIVKEKGELTDKLGGIIDGNGKYIKGSHVHYSIGSPYAVTGKIPYVPKTVVYLGMLCDIWGHAITDTLRRLWVLHDENFRRHFKDCPLVYVTYGGVDVFSHQPNFKRLIELLDFDISEWERVILPTQFEKIILPDESFFGDSARFFTNEYCEMIERVKSFAVKNRKPTSAKKIYFFYGIYQIGEERVAKYFNSKGYEVISPEKLTLDEQLNVLINAESFASTLGSCAHNSLFLREGTECLFIPRAANRFTTYQATINQVNNLNATYIDSTLSLFFRNGSAYCFVVSEQLKKFFGDKFDGYDEEDFRIFLQYTKFAVENNLKASPNLKAYYSEVLQTFFSQLKQTYGEKL